MKPGGGEPRGEPVALGAQVVARASRAREGGRRSAAAAACCSGVPPAKVRNCLTARVAATSSAGPEHQPIFQPVNENDLPTLEIVSVRDAIPGSVAIGMWAPS